MFNRDEVIAEFIDKGRRAQEFFQGKDIKFPDDSIEEAVDIFIHETPLPLHPEDAMMYVMHWTCNVVTTFHAADPGHQPDPYHLVMIQVILVGKILEKMHA